MKVFHCDHCDQLVFFENSQCVNCGSSLIFAPEIADMKSIAPGRSSTDCNELTPELKEQLSKGKPTRAVPSSQPVAPAAPSSAHSGFSWFWRRPQVGPLSETDVELAGWRPCANYVEHQVCNWGVANDDPDPLCLSCRLTRVIPDLSVPDNETAWRKLELAKRRLVYGLLELKLPIRNKQEDPEQGLAFEFLADTDQPVLTGHANGLVTINIAEADDAERERRRNLMREPYRTLLGHFRHEVGHYYWDRLIADSPYLDEFREIFGDERADYSEALKRHYDQGPPSDWQQRFVTTYATAHPWEDWAESWAHYLHMRDVLETSAISGLRLRPRNSHEPVLAAPAMPTDSPDGFAKMIESWYPLTYVMNNLNRGMGVADAYPFALPQSAVDKLEFIHRVIARNGVSPLPLPTKRKGDEAIPAAAAASSPKLTSQPALSAH